jgi:hypothetical protein
MNTEQHDRDATDDKLQAVYRSMANERAPERLNQQVLREASRAVRSPYAAPIRWSRPLAWATVIVVTSAILLQVADLPGPEPGALDLPEAVERVDRAAGPADDEPAERRQPDAATPVSSPVEARQAPMLEPAARAPLPEPGREAAAAARSGESAAVAAEDATLPERPAGSAPEQTAEGARQPLPQAAAVEDRSGFREPSKECSAAERADPAAWYACVERLREAGLDAAADEQLEALLDTFPEFEAPR